jgi:transposase
MPCKTDVAIAHAISIDTGKNTLHMIGLDEKGAIVLLSTPDFVSV